MAKSLATLLVLTALLVSGLVGLMLSWSSGSTWAAAAFGLGALTVSLLIIAVFFDDRRKRQGRGVYD